MTMGEYEYIRHNKCAVCGKEVRITSTTVSCDCGTVPRFGGGGSIEVINPRELD